eukprot:364990-Chlamydomonas_euryale.AAC.12
MTVSARHGACGQVVTWTGPTPIECERRVQAPPFHTARSLDHTAASPAAPARRARASLRARALHIPFHLPPPPRRRHGPPAAAEAAQQVRTWRESACPRPAVEMRGGAPQRAAAGNGGRHAHRRAGRRRQPQGHHGIPGAERWRRRGRGARAGVQP